MADDTPTSKAAASSSPDPSADDTADDTADGTSADAPLRPLYETADDAALGHLALGLAGGGDLRWAVTDLTAPFADLQRRLDPSPLAAIAMARTVSSAVLLLRFSSKREGKLRVEIAGDGPLGKVVAEADTGGLFRASVGDLHAVGDDPTRIDVGTAVGEGFFRVHHQMEGLQPYLSQVALVDGEIGNDLVHYLHQSQQVRSAALLGALPGDTGLVAVGGLLVEALPGASEDSLAALEASIARLDGVGERLREGGLDGLRDALLADLEPEELERHPVRYGCRCSRDVLLDRLVAMPLDDLEHIAGDDGLARLECAYCQGSFLFSPDELRAN